MRSLAILQQAMNPYASCVYNTIVSCNVNHMPDEMTLCDCDTKEPTWSRKWLTSKGPLGKKTLMRLVVKTVTV